MGKPTKAKPGLYAIFYEHLKDIAKHYGYNLIVHGSMDRDLDLLAVPWVDNPIDEQVMIKDFQRYLIGRETVMLDDKVYFTKQPGGRHAYSISLNRGDRKGEWVRFEDREYYLDISVVQTKI